MAVVVAAPRAHHGHLGPDGPEERRVGGGAAVVWHLQQAGAQRGRCREQARLGLALGVAGEQRASRSLVDAQDERHLVHLGVRPREGRPAVRSEDVHRQAAHRGPLARHRLVDDDTSCPREGPQVDGGVVLVDRPQPQGPDPHPVEDGGQATDVVGVRVAEDDEVQPPDPPSTEPAGDLVLVRPAVDQDACPAALDQQRVALPNVDGGDGQRRRRGAGDGHQQGRPHDGRRQ